jgi:hypothetical protein
LQPAFKFSRALREYSIIEVCERGLQGVDLLNDAPVRLHQPLIAAAE